jgi:hypothetical protein
LSSHSVAVFLTPVQTKQIRVIYINETIQKTKYKQHKTVNTSTHIIKTPTHTHTHTVHNKLKQTQYKINPNEIVTI